MKTKSERFVVELTDDERKFLKDLIRKGGKSVSVLEGRIRCQVPFIDSTR